MRRQTRTRPAVLLVGCALTLVACSSGSPLTGQPAASSSPAATVASGTTGVATATAASSGAAVGSPGGASRAAPECAAAQLHVGETSAEGATGHVFVSLRFTNTGHAACFLQGYPGVAAVTAGGRVELNARRTLTGFASGPGQGRVTPVTIRPGQSAYAITEAEDAAPDGSAACAGKSATRLLVTPPDQTMPTSIPNHLRICADFQIHPIISSGNL